MGDRCRNPNIVQADPIARGNASSAVVEPVEVGLKKFFMVHSMTDDYSRDTLQPLSRTTTAAT